MKWPLKIDCSWIRGKNQRDQGYGSRRARDVLIYCCLTGCWALGVTVACYYELVNNIYSPCVCSFLPRYRKIDHRLFPMVAAATEMARRP